MRRQHRSSRGESAHHAIHGASRVTWVDAADGCARLTLADGRTLSVPVAPDLAAEQRVRASLRRVLGVDIVVTDDHASARVRAIGHRLPCTLPVSLATALALLAGGTPGTVTVWPGAKAVGA